MNKSVIQSAIEQRDPTLARDALREIDLLLGSTPDPNERIYLRFSKSSCHGILDNFEEARQQLSLALQQEPEDPDIRLNVEFNEGLLLQQEGKYREAFERLSTLLSDYPERLSQPELQLMYEDIQQRRAFLSVALSQFRNAIPLMQKILSFDLEREIRSDTLCQLEALLSRDGRVGVCKGLLSSSQGYRGNDGTGENVSFCSWNRILLYRRSSGSEKRVRDLRRACKRVRIPDNGCLRLVIQCLQATGADDRGRAIRASGEAELREVRRHFRDIRYEENPPPKRSLDGLPESRCVGSAEATPSQAEIAFVQSGQSL